MLIGISVAILIVLLAVIVTAFVFLYLRKFKAKSDCDDSYSTLCRGETQQLQPHSAQQRPTDLYDQIQLSPSTGQSEVISKAEDINILSLHQTSASPNIDTDKCDKISEQINASTSEQPTYAAVKKKQKKNKLVKGKKFGQHQNNAAAVEENREKIVLCSHSTVDKEGIEKNPIKQREATPTSVHTTESPEALYSAVKKKSKDNKADKEDKVPPPPPHSVEELYTAVKKDVKHSVMEEEERAPQIPPHTIEDLYTAVMKKPKGDSIDNETDRAPPIPPHTVEDC